jgi:hypothetical protein
MDNHDIRVVSLLAADEYSLLTYMSKEDGRSQSGLIRHLIVKEAQRRAVSKLLDENARNALEEPAQLVHR